MGLETRAQLDAVVAHQASTAAAAVQRQSWSGAPAAPAPGALHLAALQALLASVLAPCRHAPPFLPHALHLFSQVCSLQVVQRLTFCVQIGYVSGVRDSFVQMGLAQDIHIPMG